MSVKSWISRERVKPLVPKPKHEAEKVCPTVRCRAQFKKILESTADVLRSGIQWKALPKAFGSSSSIHTSFLKWQEADFFQKLWKKRLAEYDELEESWRWKSIDGTMNKAPLRKKLSDETQRIGKKGTKRNLLGDENDIPLSITV